MDTSANIFNNYVMKDSLEVKRIDVYIWRMANFICISIIITGLPLSITKRLQLYERPLQKQTILDHYQYGRTQDIGTFKQTHLFDLWICWLKNRIPGFYSHRHIECKPIKICTNTDAIFRS